MNTTACKLDITIHGSTGLHERHEEMRTVYTEVYSDRLDDPFYALPRYRERLAAYSAREGFAFATGRIDGEPICYALGTHCPPERTGGKGCGRTSTRPC